MSGSICTVAQQTSAAPAYVLGRSEEERGRLIAQSNALQPVTEQVFRRAGIGPGMSVLDLGCGAGDVSFLAATLVGPKGAVLGIDNAPAVLAAARNRAADLGLNQVRFERQSLETFQETAKFDAVVGRLVLMYQADPVLTLRRAAAWARPGGILAFHESDMTLGLRSCPTVPLWEQVGEWIAGTFRRGLVDCDIGSRLYALFLAAGLPGPAMSHFAVVGGGARLRGLCRHYEASVKSLLPRMVEYGITTEAEAQPATLAQRLEEQITARRAQVTSFAMVGAWTTTATRTPG